MVGPQSLGIPAVMTWETFTLSPAEMRGFSLMAPEAPKKLPGSNPDLTNSGFITTSITNLSRS